QLEQLLSRQVRIDGVTQVTVGLAVARKPSPDQWKGVTKVHLIAAANQPVRRAQELEHHRATAGSNHAPHLRQTLLREGQVAQAERGGGDVEACAVERQVG